MVIYHPTKKKEFWFSNLSLTTKLIILNVFIFILVSVLSAIYTEQAVFSLLALVPANIMLGEKVWTIFTHMFLHANILHLFFNMFSLWFIGKNLEKIVGSKRLLIYYLLSGIFAGLVFVLLSGLFGYGILGDRLFGNPMISGVGASGAIFGLLGVMVMLVPRTKIFLIAGPIIAIILQSILESTIKGDAILMIISLVINFYILISIFAIMFYNPKLMKLALSIEMPLWILPIAAILPLIVIGLIFPLPIANTAHLGGLIAGLAFGYYLKLKYRNKVMLLRRMFR